MPGFQFELSQLVNVPGKNQQGRVSARMEYPVKLSVYEVSWLDECCEPCAGLFTTEEMIEAQKPKPDGKAKLIIEVDDSEVVKATNALDDLNHAALTAEATINRLPRNVLNPRRTTKRKNKR